jgi:hypothetical protein
MQMTLQVIPDAFAFVDDVLRKGLPVLESLMRGVMEAMIMVLGMVKFSAPLPLPRIVCVKNMQITLRVLRCNRG